MTYTPTVEELEEMGFTENEYWTYYIKLHKILDIYIIFEKSWFAIIYKYSISVFPKSKQDIETLIRLFTQP